MVLMMKDNSVNHISEIISLYQISQESRRRILLHDLPGQNQKDGHQDQKSSMRAGVYASDGQFSVWTAENGSQSQNRHQVTDNDGRYRSRKSCDTGSRTGRQGDGLQDRETRSRGRTDPIPGAGEDLQQKTRTPED